MTKKQRDLLNKAEGMAHAAHCLVDNNTQQVLYAIFELIRSVLKEKEYNND